MSRGAQTTLNKLSPSALSAAMRGGTAAWEELGSSQDHVRYAEPIAVFRRGRRRKCHCGCSGSATYGGFANGVCLMEGCELRVRRWVRDGR